jgi:glucan 1,3-beta-glucosidase
MILARFAVLTALALAAACEQLKIPAVEKIVDNILHEYERYVDYKGNASSVAVSSSSAVTKRQSTAYWYESISHQGISAFGPSGYAVYRNVKDYGATGMCLA